METFHKVCQRFLRFLLNFGEVYAGPRLFLDGDELTNEPVGQILEARNDSWWQAVKPRLCHSLQSSGEISTICCVIHILDIHLCLINP